MQKRHYATFSLFLLIFLRTIGPAVGKVRIRFGDRIRVTTSRVSIGTLVVFKSDTLVLAVAALAREVTAREHSKSRDCGFYGFVVARSPDAT